MQGRVIPAERGDTHLGLHHAAADELVVGSRVQQAAHLGTVDAVRTGGAARHLHDAPVRAAHSHQRVHLDARATLHQAAKEQAALREADGVEAAAQVGVGGQ